MEWSNTSQYNSFNSFKGLCYFEHYQKIVGWLEDGNKLPPPIECSLDPIEACNHHCYYCNSQRYLKDRVVYPQLSWGEMYNLIQFLAGWGVKGLCFGGGGESTLNNEVPTMINIAHQRNMEVAMITNGSVFHDSYLREALLNCRWVGISVDASNKEEYKRIRGVDTFDLLTGNIRRLVEERNKAKSELDIAFKFLVLPENMDSIYEACKLAKDLGVDDFHVRPVDLERKDYKNAQKHNFDIERIKEQFEMCHTEETDDFHVYTVIHKYDEEFHVKHDFKKCLASPLVLQVCTDRNCYVCVDHRMEDRFKLGAWEDVETWWGSKKHRGLVQGINPSEECSRCTWSEYNRQIEETVMEDKLCIAFP